MITKFEIFESYLEGGRQPLYHYTSSYRISEIFESDELKTSTAADLKISISFSRSLYYSDAGDTRIVLDADKLKKDGYKIVPYDEVGTALVNSSSKKARKNLDGYSKVNPTIPFKQIIGNNRIKYDIFSLEWEYEERCFENIKNLGKYIIAIDIPKNRYNVEDFEKYLEKYPHIEIFEYNGKETLG